eukprot:TRINITY_DN84929_c0_g1_i1.p1 TRINITY_DN84929_c0_g1~~TRINITY_DN84929_c0_g1_i1.p1  ORF type:complete len:110 (+),score=16.34 TRINITY_DN84929_c0_g1_i1:59-388(+)
MKPECSCAASPGKSSHGINDHVTSRSTRSCLESRVAGWLLLGLLFQACAVPADGLDDETKAMRKEAGMIIMFSVVLPLFAIIIGVYIWDQCAGPSRRKNLRSGEKDTTS